MKPVVKVALHFLFPKQNRRREFTGDIILISGDVPKVVVKAREAVLVETEGQEVGISR